MIEKLFERTELPFPDDKIEIFTDGNTDYIYVPSDYYAETCIDYGQLIKIRGGGKVVDKEKRIIYGNPDITDIEPQMSRISMEYYEKESADWCERQNVSRNINEDWSVQ